MRGRQGGAFPVWRSLPFAADCWKRRRSISFCRGKLEEEKAGRVMWLLQEKNRKNGERIPLQEKSGRGKFRKMESAS